MKKTFLPVLAIAAFISLTIGSCTKEQTLLDLLYGTWTLDQELDYLGVIEPFVTTVTVGSNTYVTTVATEATFFDCNDKEEEKCYGTSKTTTTVTTNGVPDVSYGASSFEYIVFGKSQLVWNGTVYEIDEVSKKDLVIHPVSAPLAKKTYSKQK